LKANTAVLAVPLNATVVIILRLPVHLLSFGSFVGSDVTIPRSSVFTLLLSKPIARRIDGQGEITCLHLQDLSLGKQSV